MRRQGDEGLDLALELGLGLGAVLRDGGNGFVGGIVEHDGGVTALEHDGVEETAFDELEATSKPGASLHVTFQRKRGRRGAPRSRYERCASALISSQSRGRSCPTAADEGEEAHFFFQYARDRHML